MALPQLCQIAILFYSPINPTFVGKKNWQFLFLRLTLLGGRGGMQRPPDGSRAGEQTGAVPTALYGLTDFSPTQVRG